MFFSILGNHYWMSELFKIDDFLKFYVCNSILRNKCLSQEYVKFFIALWYKYLLCNDYF